MNAERHRGRASAAGEVEGLERGEEALTVEEGESARGLDRETDQDLGRESDRGQGHHIKGISLQHESARQRLRVAIRDHQGDLQTRKDNGNRLSI